MKYKKYKNQPLASIMITSQLLSRASLSTHSCAKCFKRFPSFPNGKTKVCQSEKKKKPVFFILLISANFRLYFFWDSSEVNEGEGKKLNLNHKKYRSFLNWYELTECSNAICASSHHQHKYFVIRLLVRFINQWRSAR